MTFNLASRYRLAPRLAAIAAVVTTIAVVAILVGWGRLAVGAEATPPGDVALQPVLAGLQARDAAITSASADYTFETEENQDPAVLAYRDPDMGPSAARRVIEGHWAFDRRSFYEDHRLVYPEVAEELSFNAFDGQQGRAYDAAAKWGEETPADWMSNSLTALSQVGAWLHLAHNFKLDEPTQGKLLLDAKATVVNDAADLNGVKCFLLEAKDGKRTECWWVSPDRGWLVLKHERSVGAYNDEIVARKATWTIQECAEVDGVWMPTVLTGLSEHTWADGRTLWRIKQKLTLTYQDVNKPVPATTFQPTFPTGTRVLGSSGIHVAGE